MPGSVTVRITKGKPKCSTEHSSDDTHLVTSAMDFVFSAFKVSSINESPVEWSTKMVVMYVKALEKRGLTVHLRDPRAH